AAAAGAGPHAGAPRSPDHRRPAAPGGVDRRPHDGTGRRSVLILAVSSLSWQGAADLEEILQGTAALGFQGIEINLGSREAPLKRLTRDYCQEAGDRARRLGLRLAAHAPALDLNPMSGNPLVRELTFDQYRAALEAA